jgi:hypothetical protein
VDVRVPRTIDSVETKSVTDGPYYFRVSGIDADAFEGPFSELKRTHAGKLYWAALPASSPDGQKGMGRILAAPDLTCSVDGSSIATVVSAYAPHRVQCTTVDGAVLSERTLAALPAPIRSLPRPALPAPPVKEPLRIVPELSVGVTSRTPLALTGGLALRIPLEGVSLQIGVRVGYETPVLSLKTRAPQFGDVDTTYTVGVLRTDAPFLLRFGKSAFAPTLTLGPSLFIQESTFELPSGEQANGYALSIGLFGKLGAEYEVGPGALFADLGYRRNSTRSFEFANRALRGATFDLGYRFLLK